ncbi:hypothetical protein ACI48D_09640 [Massilia sp. LXY-6]|uniref:hypothetical protein n=1 Tax=Massilia sp. LXY-6 TaxID=3379823 RepID=UPI003EE0E9B2
MQFASIVVAAGIGIGCCALADADANADRSRGDWTEAQSLRELPAGVQVLLGVGLSPHDGGIADRGENFNSSDVWSAGMPPVRRFVLGLVSGDKALVALEQGGRAHQFKAVEFRQAGTTWEPVRCVATRALPHRGAELLESVAANRPPEACSLATVLPSGAADTAVQAPNQAPIQPPIPAGLRLRPGG